MGDERAGTKESALGTSAARSRECGSFGCTLPAGHNRGRADIPENHSVAAPIRGCVKCGSSDVSVSWHGAGADHITRQYAECRKYGRDRGEPAAEHLCCTCRVCQYRWKEDVLDALA